MVSAVMNDLVRRGMQTMQSSTRMNVHPNQSEKVEVPVWAFPLVAGTILLFILAIFSISYTYGEVVFTLASVESSQSTVIVRTAPEDGFEDAPVDAPLLLLGQDKSKLDIDQEVLLIKQRPITSRFCSIRRHLRARGGRLARYRGLHIYLLNAFLFSMISGLLSGLTRSSLLFYTIFDIIAYVLLTRLQLLWNHMVISEPSSQSWWARMPSRAAFRKALAPTAIYATITKSGNAIILFTALSTGVIPGTSYSHNVDDAARLRGSILVLAVATTYLFGIQIPLDVAMTRVRASLLSMDEEPIVPFDRSFDGKVIPAVAGGSGILSLWQAWAGADRSTRLRAYGVIAKVFAMQVVMMLLAVGVFVGELRLIFGPDYREKIVMLAVQTIMTLNSSN